MKVKLIKPYEVFPGVFAKPGEIEILPELYPILFEGGYLEVKQLKTNKNGTNNRNYKRK